MRPDRWYGATMDRTLHLAFASRLAPLVVAGCFSSSSSPSGPGASFDAGNLDVTLGCGDLACDSGPAGDTGSTAADSTVEATVDAGLDATTADASDASDAGSAAD